MLNPRNILHGLALASLTVARPTSVVRRQSSGTCASISGTIPGGVPPWEGGCYRNETNHEPWPGWNTNTDSNDNDNKNDNGYHPADSTEGDPPWWTWDTFHQTTSVLALSADNNDYTEEQSQTIDTALNQMSGDPYKILVNTLLDSLRPPDPQDGSMIRLPTPDVVAFLRACSAAGRCTIAAVAGDRWTRIVNSADNDDETDVVDEIGVTVDIVDGNHDDGSSIGILNLGLQGDCTSTGCDSIDVSVDVDVGVYQTNTDNSYDSGHTSDDSWPDDDTDDSTGRAWDLLVNQNAYVMFDMRSVAVNGTDIVLPVYIFDPWA